MRYHDKVSHFLFAEQTPHIMRPTAKENEMFKNGAFQVKYVKDKDAVEAPPEVNYEEVTSTVLEATAVVTKEAAKMVALTLIVNAGCKILINRLSK